MGLFDGRFELVRCGHAGERARFVCCRPPSEPARRPRRSGALMACTVAGYRFYEGAETDEVGLRIDLVLSAPVARRVYRLFGELRTAEAMSVLVNVLMDSVQYSNMERQARTPIDGRLYINGVAAPVTYPQITMSKAEIEEGRRKEQESLRQLAAQFFEQPSEYAKALRPTASFTIGFARSEPEKKATHTLVREIDIPEEE